MAGLDNIYSALAKEKESNMQTGLDYSKIREGGVAAAVMAQAGGMLGGAAMQAAGYQTPAQIKQQARNEVKAMFPNPQTKSEMIAMANAFKNFGQMDDYEKIMNLADGFTSSDTTRKTIKGADGFQYYQDTGERVLPNVTAKESTTGTALNQADRIIFNSMKDEFGEVEGANKFANWKQKQRESEARAGTDFGSVKPSDVAKISNDWRSETGSIRESIATIDNAKELIDQAAAGNATAYKQVNRFLIKVVGDSQISKAEVDDMLSAGSLPERLTQTLTMWSSGKPTKTKATDIRTILNALNQLNKKRVNKARNRFMAAYGTTYLPSESYEAILGPEYDLGVNVSDATMDQINAEIAAKTGAQ